MIRRSLSAYLGVVALVVALGLSTCAIAKPPDLPANETITVTPQAAPSPECAPFGMIDKEFDIIGGGPRPIQKLGPPDSTIQRLLLHSLGMPMPAHPLLSDIKMQVSETGSWFFSDAVISGPRLTGKCERLKVVQSLMEEKLPPAASLYEALPATMPTPTLYQLRPTARRTLVGSILFGINPVLGLLPTEKVLDAPQDHPQREAGDDLFSNMPTKEEDGAFSGNCVSRKELDWLKWVAIWYGAPAPEQNDGCVHDIVTLGAALDALVEEIDAPPDHPPCVAEHGVFGDMPTYEVVEWGSGGPELVTHKELDWLKWRAMQQGVPAPEQNEGYIHEVAFVDAIAYLTPEDSPAQETDAPLTPDIETLPMPKEDATTNGITCPYLRQQMKDRHACQFADPQIGRDVLDNLERLKQADDLIEIAKMLAHDGCIIEAMECCVLAEDLCPGSPSADRAAAVAFDLCFGFDKPAMAAEEAAEEEPDTPTDSHSQGQSVWEWLTQWIGLPVNVYDPEPNKRILELLHQSAELDTIEAEWERIWFTDMPSHLTPERVHGGICPDDTPCPKRSSAKPTIETKLNQSVTVNFNNTPLRDIIEFIRADSGINIYVDEPALAEKGICLDKPITIKLEDIALKSALNLILHGVHLVYVVKDEVLHITTEEHAHPNKLEQRIYAVADLLEHEKLPKKSGITPCKDGSRENRLIDVITRTVLPRSWSAMGGSGAIDYFPDTQSLIVNQTADAQDQIADLLAALRRLYDKENKAKEKSHPKKKAEASRTEPGVAEEVGGLMKACRLLMNEGLHEQAAELARQAYALDPERVMADPLIYKMHLLADTPVKPSSGSSEDCEPSSCPYCPSIGKPIPGIVPEKKASKSSPTTLLIPPLPPVDYEVVPVLDRVLTEPAGAEEESEEEAPSSLQELIETIMDGAGVDADGGLRLSGEWSCGGNVYHLRYHRGCLAIWKTPDAAKLKP
ncbi:MAG TPA: hypothetical protein VH682_21875 [Gemmataceae bacterium]|jgi:hypothetical protein